jgi:hypothetical protein
MRVSEEVEIQLPALLISTLDAGEWSASRPGLFPPGKEPPVPIE